MSTENILSYLKVMGRTITYLMRTHKNIHKNIKSSRVNSLYYSRRTTFNSAVLSDYEFKYFTDEAHLFELVQHGPVVTNMDVGGNFF